MSIHAPTTDRKEGAQPLTVKRLVSWQEAIAEAECLGCRVNTSVPSQIDASTRQQIALRLLMEHDWGIEGHNYDSKQRPVYAKVESDLLNGEPSEKVV